MSNGIEVIENKFLKFIWLLTSRDWTNELVIVGVIALAIIQRESELSNVVAGGLIGYLTRAAHEVKESPV
jgi:hypothetical protein